MHGHPAEIGMAIEEVETPSLILDLDACERNIAKMAESARQAGVRLRPHAKSHRCPALAVRQVAAGAVGLCVQTVGEAEALVDAGVGDVLVSNQIVSAGKLRRLAALSGKAAISLCFDNPEQVSLADRVADECGAVITGFVEVEVGMRRCGVPSGEPVADLALQIASSRALRFGGLHAYHGRAQHIESYKEREGAVSGAVDKVKASMHALDRRGLRCDVVTGAGTGTFQFEAASGVYNELQVGSYLFMDLDYARIQGEDGEPFTTFEHALFILSTVISRPRKDEAIADAGIKSYSLEKGFPAVRDDRGGAVVSSSDEHCILRSQQASPYRIGEKLKFIPGHCDPTVNVHDHIIGYRNGLVTEILNVSARGASA